MNERFPSGRCGASDKGSSGSEPPCHVWRIHFRLPIKMNPGHLHTVFTEAQWKPVAHLPLVFTIGYWPSPPVTADSACAAGILTHFKMVNYNPFIWRNECFIIASAHVGLQDLRYSKTSRYSKLEGPKLEKQLKHQTIIKYHKVHNSLTKSTAKIWINTNLIIVVALVSRCLRQSWQT